jgi:flagellar biosynthesis/type III secretory pathway protein FliH
MNRDGRKLAGRFIKRSDRLMDHVAIGKFSFEEICPSEMAYFDNDDSSIIHVRLHEPSNLEKTVRQHPNFDVDISPQDGEREVILPRDFTNEWRSYVSPSSGRTRRPGRGDDVMELNDEGQRQFAEIFGGGAASSVFTSRAAESQEKNGASNAEQSPLAADAGVFRINREDIRSAPAAQDLRSSQPQPPSEEFIPLGTAPASASVDSVSQVETAAVDNWKARREMEEEANRLAAAAREDGLKSGLEEGRKSGYEKGYEEGFKIGEEKGELSARQVASQFFGRAGDLIKEFESLKGQILDNVQQNFFDLCQAMGEALLEREFEIHPEAFASIMRKAVTETVKGDQFTIRVNPATAEAMAKAGVQDLDSHIVKDAAVPAWEFKLESQLSVVDVQAKKMIRSLLGQADVSLFKKEDKAG